MMDKKEIWRDVVGFENLYKVSNFGNVISIEREVPNGPCTTRIVPSTTLSKLDNGKGYITVTLSKGCTPKKYYIHRLVATAFLPNPNSFKEINHKDENKSNNHLSNLEWCTSSYNKRYGTCIKRLIETRNKNKRGSYEKPVYAYDLNGNFVKEYRSIAEASRKTGISEESLRSAIMGKSKSSGCFQWTRVKSKNVREYPTNKKYVKVTSLTMDETPIKTYNTATEAAKDTGCEVTKVVACCRGKRHFSKGYKFKYA